LAVAPSWRWEHRCSRHGFDMSRSARRRRPTTLTDGTQVHKNLPLVPDLRDGDNPRWERDRRRRRTWGMAGSETHDDGARRRAMRRAVRAEGFNSGAVCLHRASTVDGEEGTEPGEPLNSGRSGERIRTGSGYVRSDRPRSAPGTIPRPSQLPRPSLRPASRGASLGQPAAKRRPSEMMYRVPPRGLQGEGAL
jgi:hypothetical protein